MNTAETKRVIERVEVLEGKRLESYESHRERLSRPPNNLEGDFLVCMAYRYMVMDFMEFNGPPSLKSEY